jgi:hypothetical protein
MKSLTVIFSSIIAGLLLFALSSLMDVDVDIAQAQHGSSGRYSNVFVTHAYESQVGTSTNVLAITPGIINTTGLEKTQRAYIAVTGTTIRWTADGTTPSGTVGNPTLVNSWLEIIGQDDINNFQWTQDGGAGTSTLYINLQYEKEMK